MSSVPQRLRSRTACGGVVALCVGGLLACQSDPSHNAGGPADAGSMGDPNPIDGASLPALCGRERDDAVRDIFCKGGSPDIRSLRDLETRLDLAFSPEGISGT